MSMAYPMQQPPLQTPPAMAAQQRMAAPADQGKLSHAEVRYRMAAAGAPRRCAACRHYDGPNNCEIVAAPIYPAGDCDKFSPQGPELNSAAKPMAPAGPAFPGVEPMPSAAAPVPASPPSVSANPVMAHGRAIAGAHALHAVGHISPQERDRHIGKSQAAIAKAKPKAKKPFGSFAP